MTTHEPLLRRLLRENVVVLLLTMLVVIPVLGPFTYDIHGRALRNGLLQAIAIVLLIVLLARVQVRGLSRLPYLAKSGVNALVALLLLWTALGTVWAPERAFAVGELFRLGTGVLIYFVVALHLENRSQLCLLIDGLLGIILLVTGCGLILQINRDTGGVSSILPSRHHLSAILTVLFPLTLSLALQGTQKARRVVAISTAILCGVGLLLCLERTAWFAVSFGCALWCFLGARCPVPGAQREEGTRERGNEGTRERRSFTPSLLHSLTRSLVRRPCWAPGTGHRAPRRRRLSPTLVIVAAVLLVAGAFLAVTDVHAVVSPRAREVITAAQGRDDSLNWRVRKWRGAAAMVAARPALGWGPGQFVLHQQRYTSLGGTADEVRRRGASFDEMAFNEYLQTAAELGLPGLFLYLAMLSSFFMKAGRALGRLPDGLRRTVLLGCIAGVAAQMIDAMANGSWRYVECSLFFWLVLGLGTSVIRMAYQTRE